MARSNAGNSNRRQNSGGNKNAAENLSREDRAKGGRVSGGNFKNDRERASEAGKKGGSK